MGHYKDLLAYQKAYQLAMKIFPPEEKFSLTDQIKDHHVLYAQTLQKPIEEKGRVIILSAN